MSLVDICALLLFCGGLRGGGRDFAIGHFEIGVKPFLVNDIGVKPM